MERKTVLRSGAMFVLSLLRVPLSSPRPYFGIGSRIRLLDIPQGRLHVLMA